MDGEFFKIGPTFEKSCKSRETDHDGGVLGDFAGDHACHGDEECQSVEQRDFTFEMAIMLYVAPPEFVVIRVKRIECLHDFGSHVGFDLWSFEQGDSLSLRL